MRASPSETESNAFEKSFELNVFFVNDLLVEGVDGAKSLSIWIVESL